MNHAPADHSAIGKVKISIDVPADWIELAGSMSAEQSVASMREALKASGVHMGEKDQRTILAGFQSWRDFWDGRSVLIHGLVYQGAEHAGESAVGEEIFINVMVAVQRLSPFQGGLPLMEIVRRVIAAKMQFDLATAYTESFDTKIGPAVGLATRASIVRTPQEEAIPGTEDQDVGLAAVATAPAVGGAGLILVGWSINPSHVSAVGSLLAAMAASAEIVAFDSGKGMVA